MLIVVSVLRPVSTAVSLLVCVPVDVWRMVVLFVLKAVVVALLVPNVVSNVVVVLRLVVLSVANDVAVARIVPRLVW